MPGLLSDISGSCVIDMPKTIPCWDCKGPGCETCGGGGVLSVYTQGELDKAVKAERERWIVKILDCFTLEQLEAHLRARGNNG